MLLRIAEELRAKLPAALADHRLVNLWAYSYGNAGHDESVGTSSGNAGSRSSPSSRRGLGLHADFAAVHVTLWLTPDEANLDPSSGGLEVFHRLPPPGSKFAAFNCNRGADSAEDASGEAAGLADAAAMEAACAAELATFVEQGGSTVRLCL